MDASASLGLWIRRRRRALDLTQEELAARVGCAAITLRKIEADERRPSRQIAERLADQLGLTPEERSSFLLAVQAALCPDQLPTIQRPAAPSIFHTPVKQDPAAQTVLPQGTVTFLACVLRGYPGQQDLQPAVIAPAMQQVRRVLDDTVAAYEGIVWRSEDVHTWAAFSRPLDAVLAAVNAQRALHHIDWPSNGLGAGIVLHSGKALPSEGTYHGALVARTGALLSVVHAGQILLSEATSALTQHHLPPDLTLSNLGVNQLAALGHSEPLYQLVAPDLPSNFSPLATHTRRPHNLPNYTTSLIGREVEVAEITALLRQQDIRLLTLSGVGGTGKTRLSVQAAQELCHIFVDGVVFVDLTPLRDPDLVVGAIAQVLEIKEQSGDTPHQRLIAELRNKDMLLIIDNFEHLMPAAELVIELLHSAPRLKILITSRALLCISVEHEYAVPPLTLPHPKPTERLPLDQLRRSPAVELFVQRACMLMPNLPLTEANLRAIAEICARLDGLPLAIELAAARIKLLSPPALLARLQRRLAVLTGGARDLPPRQHSLRLAIDWSHDLLSPAEQTLFRRLSIFAGGGTIEAIEAICGDPGHGATVEATPILDLLGGLVQQSLVQCVESPVGEPRFVLLETIREYALEQLEACEELARLQKCYMAYYRTLAGHLIGTILNNISLEWFQQLTIEQHNLHAVLFLALEQGDNTTALHICAVMWTLWRVGDMWPTGLGHMEAAIALGENAPPHVLAAIYNGLGALSNYAGNDMPAIAYCQRALALYQEMNNRLGEATLLHNMGFLALRRNDLGTAHRYYTESLHIQQSLSEPIGLLPVTIFNLALLHMEEGDLVSAERRCMEAIAQPGSYQEIVISTLALRVRIRIARDELAAGWQLLEEALQLARFVEPCMWRYWLLEDSALAATIQHDMVNAAKLLGAAETMRMAGIPDLAGIVEHRSQIISRTRSHCPPDAFATAWREGQMMLLQQAIDLALDIVGKAADRIAELAA